MTVVQVDVAFIGGGLGGCAGALAAAELGMRVALIEPTDRIGGQISAQLVSALDEHPTVEQFPCSARYASFRAGVRAASGGVDNPGGGWVSRLCFLPAVGQQVLEQMLAARGVLVSTGLRPIGVNVAGRLLREVALSDGTTLRADVFCDATELGDLLPLTGTPFVTGSEGTRYGEADALDEPDERAMQAFTWCMLVEHVPGASFQPVQRPAGYERWLPQYSFEIAGWDGQSHRYRMFADGPDGRPPFWTYRRLSRQPEVALINWVSNDYADASLVHEPARAIREARDQSLGFLHWLQTSAPHDTGGDRGFASLRLAPELAGTPDGLAVAPYVRESRRLQSEAPLTSADIAPRAGRARARPVADSVGVAHYAADLHPRIGAARTVYAPTAPFQLPMRALVASYPDNLLAAAKNIAATQIAASAWRVHSGEWVVGEAAGTLAAHCVTASARPAAVVSNRAAVASVQTALITHGTAVAWTLGLSPEDPLWLPAQLLAARGAIAGRRAEALDIDPDGTVDDRDVAAVAGAVARLAADLGVRTPKVATSRTWRRLVLDATAALPRALASP